jgi:predicted DCC family thiol-disulfide oxidoreductase YuxK
MNTIDETMRAEDKPDTPSVTVFYDGSCPLCRREIGLYGRAEGAGTINWCDVSASAELPRDLTAAQAMARFHVRDEAGVLTSGAKAFIVLWLSLPRWRWLGRLASVPPIPLVLEGLYRLFLRFRPALQRVARRLDRRSGGAASG